MRIALSGSHQVGKTTLISALPSSFATVGGVMREVAANGFGVAANTEPKTIEEYIRLQVASEHARQRTDHVISDRVLLDGLAYVEAAVRTGVARYEWTENELRLLRAAAKLHANTFDLHCYVPIEFDVSSELPFHGGGEELRRTVADVMERHLADDWPIPVLSLRGSVEERLDSLLRFVDSEGLEL